jgi:hypothetical protein
LDGVSCARRPRWMTTRATRGGGDDDDARGGNKRARGAVDARGDRSLTRGSMR